LLIHFRDTKKGRTIRLAFHISITIQLKSC
jgi:hypothetical protein